MTNGPRVVSNFTLNTSGARSVERVVSINAGEGGAVGAVSIAAAGAGAEALDESAARGGDSLHAMANIAINVNATFDPGGAICFIGLRVAMPQVPLTVID